MRCPNCDYDRMDLIHPCPECGVELSLPTPSPLVHALDCNLDELHTAAKYLALRSILQANSWGMIVIPLALVLLTVATHTYDIGHHLIEICLFAIVIGFGIRQLVKPTPALLIVNGVACTVALTISLLLTVSTDRLLDIARWSTAALFLVNIGYVIVSTVYQYRRFRDLCAYHLPGEMVQRLRAYITKYPEMHNKPEWIITFTGSESQYPDYWYAEYLGSHVLFACFTARVSPLRIVVLTDVCLVPVTEIKFGKPNGKTPDGRYNMDLQIEDQVTDIIIERRMLDQLEVWRASAGMLVRAE